MSPAMVTMPCKRPRKLSMEASAVAGLVSGPVLFGFSISDSPVLNNIGILSTGQDYAALEHKSRFLRPEVLRNGKLENFSF